VQSYSRRQLKQDKFVETTGRALHWTEEHRNTLIAALAVVILALGAYIGYTAWTAAQDDQASFELGNAVRTYTAAIRPAGEAVQPDGPAKTFASIAERSGAAMNEFQQVADKYPRTRNGHMARYLAGVAALDKGDIAAAESNLKRAADADRDTATLAKFALAGLYRSQQKTDDAAKLYRDLIDADSAVVGKTQAQLALAEMYETKNPAEAVKVYEQIVKDEQAKVKEEEKKQPKAQSGSKTPPAPGSTPGAAPEQKTPLQQQAEGKIQQLKSTANKK
jgi:predicted negative regulator of RcsB-dependent stress response